MKMEAGTVGHRRQLGGRSRARRWCGIHGGEAGARRTAGAVAIGEAPSTE
jgi:hypothetical protein